MSLLTASPGAATAAPDRADVVLGLTAEPGDVGPDGGRVGLAVSVRNAGGAEATDSTIKFTLPPGSTLDFGDSLGRWTCDAAKLKCTYGTLPAGTDASFVLSLRLPPGTDGQQGTVTATATTQSRESSTTNNTASANIEYVAKPDLAFSFEYSSGEISYLGGNGARGFVQARATNIGTTPAPDARFTFQMPPDAFAGAWTTDPDWNCDFSTSTWVCDNNREIPPGGAAYLNLYPYFPAGTVGDTRTVTGSVSTSATERSLTNNSGSTTFTYVVPPLGDVELFGADVVGRVDVRAGDEFDLAVHLGVQGGSPAENVAVRVPLPPTVEPTSLDPGDANWTCRLDDAADDRVVECTRAFWDIGTENAVLRLKLKVNPGTPDGPLTFTATASASSPESSLENNTATGSVTYVAEGAITGHVWLDLDRDGQRDADEPMALDKVASYTVVPETGQLPPGWGGINTNTVTGTYWGRLKPGRYTVKVNLPPGSTTQFTTPDQGDDATDSDIITRVDGYYPYGLSALIEIHDGAETFVDVGILPVS
ncbi:SdrD B-like domain-containing protein [Micromonospora sp. NPDC051296]|uniref:SdrD B-like domain-containing protein n=1 Tax=Micromonospora sp. NPDC051296 TaxID=3155046 RepID=UPI00342DC26B